MNKSLATSDGPANQDHPIAPAAIVRPTFSDDVMLRSKQFATDLLRLIPELEGVAVVPSFTVPQDRLPYGLIMGRNGQLNTPTAIMHMAAQLHGCLQIQLDNAFKVLVNVDTHMGEMQNQLRLLQEQIDAKQNQLAELSSVSEDATPDA